MRLQLAQAKSNRAPHGRKHDFRDAERLVRRLLAEELTLSFVPDAEQRAWRTMTRTKLQLIRDRVRLRNQLEGLLEEMRLKLSSVLSDLLGATGRRILRALADGQSDPQQLAMLADVRLHCTQQQLIDALRGELQVAHRQILSLALQRLELLDKQIATFDEMIAATLRPHQDAITRLAEVPGLGIDAAQEIIAEVGPKAHTFASAAHLASWVGTCPGRDESAQENQSGSSPKGNRYMRRLLNEAAHAAVKAKGSHLQATFRRLLPRLGYKQAIWAIANRLCRLVWVILHRQVRFIEPVAELDANLRQRRARRLAHRLRQLGYEVKISRLPTAEAAA
jgi:transposase